MVAQLDQDLCEEIRRYQRYERGSIIVTTNKAYQHWPAIFNHDAGIASAILDRLLHQAETVVIEGKSYRMKDQTEPPN